MASIVGFGPADSGSIPDRTIQKTTFFIILLFFMFIKLLDNINEVKNV